MRLKILGLTTVHGTVLGHLTFDNRRVYLHSRMLTLRVSFFLSLFFLMLLHDTHLAHLPRMELITVLWAILDSGHLLVSMEVHSLTLNLNGALWTEDPCHGKSPYCTSIPTPTWQVLWG